MEKTIDESNKVTPEKIFETCWAQTTTAVLLTSVDLEVYTHIKNGHSKAVEIAKAAQASLRGMEILLNNLVAALPFGCTQPQQAAGYSDKNKP